MTLPFDVPVGPHWRVDADRLVAACSAFHDSLVRCPQDPVHHAEGSVWTHTLLAAEALAAMPAWRALPEDERDLVFTAVVLHDVGKPDCTRHEASGRISSRGHARKGALVARALLFRLGVEPRVREAICALVRHHLVPFHWLDREDGRRDVLRVSQTARIDHLALVAEADARGRVCSDLDALLESVALFAEAAREDGCLATPWRFPSEHTRFLYFRSSGRAPEVEAHDDSRGEVVLTSGLPAAGKDTWIAENLREHAVVSLDALRDELGVEPDEEQGPVVFRARELAREHLRAGRKFVWNATHLTRDLRAMHVQLAADYKARVRVVHIEAPLEVVRERNARRSRRVPEKIIERMVDRWEVPDLTEAHSVEWVVSQ